MRTDAILNAAVLPLYDDNVDMATRILANDVARLGESLRHLTGIIQSEDRALLTEAVAEFKPQCIDLVDDVAAYLDDLASAKHRRVGDTYAGQLAVSTLADCLPDIALIIDVPPSSPQYRQWESVVRTASKEYDDSRDQVSAARSALAELRSRLTAVPDNADGGRPLLKIMPRVTRVGSAAVAGMILGAAYSETIKSLIGAIVATVAVETTDAGVEAFGHRNPYSRARDASGRLRTAIRRWMLVSEDSIPLFLGSGRNEGPEQDEAKAISGVFLNLALYSARISSKDLSWPAKRQYWTTLHWVSRKAKPWVDRINEIDHFAPPRRRPRKRPEKSRRGVQNAP
ncbi:MAG: hypothetical protein AB7L91_18880 [Dehalococcoidia bacterium]